MMKPKSISSGTQSYQIVFEPISNREGSSFLRFFRNDKNLKSYSEVDANPDHWAIFLAQNIPAAHVYARTSSGLMELKGNVAVWFPPFSIIEWHLKPGTFQWFGFIGKAPFAPFSLGSKTEARCSSLGSNFDFSTLKKSNDSQILYQQLSTLFQSRYSCFSIERNPSPSSLSAAVKSRIDHGFRDDLSIQAIANDLGCSHEYLIRKFKFDFGMTPVYLRSRLRIFASLVPLLDGDSVTNAAINSGFSDINRFSKQFKRAMRAPPNKFNRQTIQGKDSSK